MAELAGAGKPMRLQPGLLGRQGMAAARKRPQRGTTDRGQISVPMAFAVWLDVRATGNRKLSQPVQLDRLVIEAADLAAWQNHQLHRQFSGLSRTTEDIPPGAIHQQAVQDGLNAGKLRGHLLPQRLVVPQDLRLDAAHDALGMTDELIELLV